MLNDPYWNRIRDLVYRMRVDLEAIKSESLRVREVLRSLHQGKCGAMQNDGLGNELQRRQAGAAKSGMQTALSVQESIDRCEWFTEGLCAHCQEKQFLVSFACAWAFDQGLSCAS